MVGEARPGSPLYGEKETEKSERSLVGTYAAPLSFNGVCLATVVLRTTAVAGTLTRLIGVTRTEEGLTVLTGLAVLTIEGEGLTLLEAARSAASSISLQ